MRPLAITAICCLSACASQDLQGYVAPLSAEGAAKAAYDITEFVGTRTNPAAGSISVQQPEGDGLVYPALTDDLRAAGYTVTDDGKRRLRYAVSAFDDGVILRATLGETSIARLYRTNAAGIMEPSGPETITDEAE